MKATILAKFFDELSRQQIPFSVDEIHEQSYEVAFGIKEQECGDKIADGIYLQVWATKNSLCDDIVYVMRQRMMWITTNGFTLLKLRTRNKKIWKRTLRISV